jgi:hypothetical protein
MGAGRAHVKPRQAIWSKKSPDPSGERSGFGRFKMKMAVSVATACRAMTPLWGQIGPGLRRESGTIFLALHF